MRTRIKICGITRLQDALHAVDAGVDALGFVFYEPSPRAVTIQQAQDIVQSLRPFVNCVGLFVNADAEYVKEVVAQTQIDTLQFHGAEDESFCQQFSLPYYKAIRMQEGIEISPILKTHSRAQGFLFDAYHPQKMGGTGESFNWGEMPAAPISNNGSGSHQAEDLVHSPAYMLAGGLNVANVYAAVLQTRPYAVDVSGGVEERPGIKSAQRIQEFVKQVQRADSQST